MILPVAVQRDVAAARRVADTIFASQGNLPPCHVTFSEGTPHRGGLCSLNIQIERFFKLSRMNSMPRRVRVVAYWEVDFTLSYPAESCTWHLSRKAINNTDNTDKNNNNSSNSDNSDTDLAMLHPYVADEMASWMEAACKSHRMAERSGEGVETSETPFVSEVALICSWWAALELDEHRILIPYRDTAMTGMMQSSSVVTMSSLTLDDYRPSGGQHFMGAAAADSVRRPRRTFSAVFIPNGRVLLWGMWSPTQRRSNPASQVHTNDEHTLQRAKHPSRKEELVQPRIHFLASVSGSPLPSLVELASTQCRGSNTLRNVTLYSDNPCDALRHNARLCRPIANAFRLLRRLIRGAPTYIAGLYASSVLAPALSQVVVELQSHRYPFWAGVAVCCVVLPAALHERPVPLFELARGLMRNAECLRCVTLVATVFAITGSALRFREAELTRMALERIGKTLQPSQCPSHSHSSAMTGGKTCVAAKGEVKVSVPAVYTPMTECAVCGLRLPQHQIHTAMTTTGSFTHSHESSPSMNADGCLTVQCVRCGHGGHVAHILGWWEDRSVRCCPKGCDCICIY